MKRFMAAIIQTTLFIMSILFSLSCSSSETLSYNSTMRPLFSELIKTEGYAIRNFSIGQNYQFQARLEGTSKGNGTIMIHNLLIRIFDQHDDGVIYDNYLLSIDTKDLTGDNIREIIISGVVTYTGDTETDAVEYEALTYIYSLNCKTGLFEIIYSHGDFSPILSNKASKPISCH